MQTKKKQLFSLKQYNFYIYDYNKNSFSTFSVCCLKLVKKILFILTYLSCIKVLIPVVNKLNPYKTCHI